MAPHRGQDPAEAEAAAPVPPNPPRATDADADAFAVEEDVEEEPNHPTDPPCDPPAPLAGQAIDCPVSGSRQPRLTATAVAMTPPPSRTRPIAVERLIIPTIGSQGGCV